MGRTVRSILAATVLLVACGDDESAEPTPTTASETTTTAEEATTTTAAPDPSVIPDDPADIDEAYVEAVLAELMHLDGEVLRLARANGPSPELADRLMAIYDGTVESAQIQSLAEAVASGFEGYADTPGDVEVDVVALVSVSPTCTSVDTVQDFRSVGPGGAAALPVRLELRSGNEASNFNPTAWVISLMHPTSETPAPEPCAG